MTEETDEERRAAICSKQGFRIEDITTWENEGAPLPYRWGACVGDFESGKTVGNRPDVRNHRVKLIHPQ
jgi:hypothetical protein